MTIKKAQRVLAETTKRLAEVVRTARRDIAAVETREELTKDAKAAAVAACRAQLREEVDSIEEGAKEAADAIKSASPARGTVDPMEAMRIWQRQQRELDSGTDPLEIARRLAGQNDRTGLQVLAEELPAFMRAAGEGDHVAGMLGEIEQVETPLLSEEEASHRQDVSAAGTALERIHINSHFVRADGETVDLLVGVGEGENIDLSEEG